MPSQEEKVQKMQLKTIWKKVLKAHAHIVITQDQIGKIQMYTNFGDHKDVAYTLTYMANDLMGKVEEFDQMVAEKVKEEVKKKADQEIDEMSEEFNNQEEE